MSRSALSLFIFAIYVLLVGVVFLSIPQTAVALLRLPPAPVGWVRVVGLLALVIGTYDIVGARAESLPYIKASIVVRLGFAIGMIILFACGEMPVSILPLAGIDASGAVSTALTLKS